MFPRMGCHCAEGWICKAHPDQPAHHDDCPGRSSRCPNDACPWWRGPLPAALSFSEWARVISRDATAEATILNAGLPDATRPDPPLTKECPECGLKGGMARQNPGLFTVYYLCSRCGTHLTIPPPKHPRGI